MDRDYIIKFKKEISRKLCVWGKQGVKFGPGRGKGKYLFINETESETVDRTQNGRQEIKMPDM